MNSHNTAKAIIADAFKQQAISELERIHALEPTPNDSWKTLYEWAKYDLHCAKLDNAQLRGLAVEDQQARYDLWYSRNHWRLAAVLGFGLAVFSLVLR